MGFEEVWMDFKKENKMWWNVPYFKKKSYLCTAFEWVFVMVTSN